MGTGFLKLINSGLLPVATLVILLLVSLNLMSDASQETMQMGRTYLWLLLANIAGLTVLLILIGVNLFRLVGQYRRRAPGSRLTARILALFVLLSLAPLTVVYYYSLKFLHRGIDSWFDVAIDHAFEDALNLSRGSLDILMRERLRQTEQIADDLTTVAPLSLAITVGDLRNEYDALELTLISRNGRIVASSSADPSVLLPHLPDQSILSQIRQEGSFVGLEPLQDEGLHIRALVREFGEPDFVLSALFPIPERLGTLADAVQAAFARYRELSFLRKDLKVYFTVTLSLVLLLSMFFAVWAGFYAARRLVRPIRDLAEGTRSVAAGDYDKRLQVQGRDELGFLVASFNDMTRRIAQARDQAARSQHQVEEQRTYLETVLGHLSSGILTVDMKCRLRKSNPAAARILGVDLLAFDGSTLPEIVEHHPHAAPFVAALTSHFVAGSADWRGEVELLGDNARQVLMCRSTPLSGPGGIQSGHVVVFDDVTALIQAQRDAAWGEVARRLAHEIKNPLTPIQLAAERLRRKYLPAMDEEASELMERATRTIVQQVGTMKEMVDAFSDYARAPHIRLQSVDLNRVVGEVLELYAGELVGPEVVTELDRAVSTLQVRADPARLSQVLHNLLKNAREALAGHGTIFVRTRAMARDGRGFVDLQVADTGCGFSEAVLDRVFEPYVTTKENGTGLGLAIVKKIVEEHGGTIGVENLPEGGSSVTMRLPIAATQAVVTAQPPEPMPQRAERGMA